MSSAIAVHTPELVTELPLMPEEVVRRQVWTVLSGLLPTGKHVERRIDQRFPFPHLLYLTPIAAGGTPLVEESIVVVGKHLSERGLGFFYQQPLAHRRMIASLETADGRWAGFVIDLTWCRFTQHGWYDSGGRFLQVVPSPIARPVRDENRSALAR